MRLLVQFALIVIVQVSFDFDNKIIYPLNYSKVEAKKNILLMLFFKSNILLSFSLNFEVSTLSVAQP